jgi:magnesium-transporting ATPase (P-type)
MSAPAARLVPEERPGLSQTEAARRLAEHGHNEIQRGKTRSAWGGRRLSVKRAAFTTSP